MSDIQWPASDEAILAMVKDKVNEHHAVLYGNGQPGLLDFISGLRGQMRLILLLLSAMVGVAAIGTLLLAIHEAQKGELKTPSIFSLSKQDSAYAIRKQDAQIPPLAR